MAKQCIDKKTGEIVTEPDFIKLYIKEMCQVKDLSSMQTKMFHFMLSNMNWENIVSYGPSSKKRFMDENNIKNQSFNNNITGMIKAGVIERVGRGEFRVNKKYAVKVEWSKVQEIEWTTRYTRSGKVEKVTFK